MSKALFSEQPLYCFQRLAHWPLIWWRLATVTQPQLMWRLHWCTPHHPSMPPRFTFDLLSTQCRLSILHHKSTQHRP